MPKGSFFKDQTNDWGWDYAPDPDKSLRNAFFKTILEDMRTMNWSGVKALLRGYSSLENGKDYILNEEQQEVCFVNYRGKYVYARPGK